ncbi:hypothetical protein H4S07_001447 [Coemansia furcata]|uniref:Uncharacterized protein n=1 Tax=Coemansia furcata TaxID=417177 RepID=A0ACC1LNS6_9FUNG|nr:hypothetical protein H4S07_001447 [Coemansia furcata]
MNTLSERRMRQMSSDIRSNSDWIEAIYNADSRAHWANEAKTKELTDAEFAYVLDELTYYASLHLPGSNIRLSAADGVWLSDTLIDTDTMNGLKDYAAVLENVPDCQKDWYPNDRSRVLNLIDPSLFPLDFSQSRLCRQASTSLQGALKIEDVVEFPGSLGGWRKALGVTENGRSDYYLPTGNGWHDLGSAGEFSWLPAEFRVDYNGAVTIESYINNLHPVKHAAFYPIIARTFSKFLPLLEQVVTDLLYPRQPRVKPDSSKYYESYEPLSDYEIDYYDNNELDYNHDDYFEVYWLSSRRRGFVPPQPEPFVVPARPVNPYKLCGRRLQAVVKISNIELDSERPIYGSKDWSVAGLANERIIATGILFYDMANIASSSLRFREAVCAWDFAIEQCDVDSVVKVYGIERSLLADEQPISQELGGIDIKDGRCLVFPNIYQYKVPELRLSDKTKPGHCKTLTFYFVDPSIRIPSTEIVPPQQQDWYSENIPEFEPPSGLSHPTDEGMLANVDFPISLEEAKKLRRLARQDETRKDITQEFFEPNVYVEFP